MRNNFGVYIKLPLVLTFLFYSIGLCKEALAEVVFYDDESKAWVLNANNNLLCFPGKYSVSNIKQTNSYTVVYLKNQDNEMMRVPELSVFINSARYLDELMVGYSSENSAYELVDTHNVNNLLIRQYITKSFLAVKLELIIVRVTPSTFIKLEVTPDEKPLQTIEKILDKAYCKKSMGSESDESPQNIE